MEHLLSFPWDELLGGWTSSLEGGVFLRLLLHDAKMQFQEPCQVHVCENVHLLPQSPASGIVLFNLAVHQRSQFYSHLRKPLAAKLRFYPRRSQPCSWVLEQWEAMRFTAAVTRGSTWSIAGSVVQSLSRVWLFGAPWSAALQASLSFTISPGLLRLMSTQSVMPFNRLTLCCHPLLLLPSIRVFSNSQLFTSGGQRNQSFSFSISLYNEYSGLISFRMDWLDLFAVQKTFKSLLQHHNSKAAVVWHPAFFMVQFSHMYMTTGKTIALSIGTFNSKVMSLLFNILSRFVIAFLPRSKRLLISWLQSPSRDFGAHKNKLSLFPLFPHLFAMTWWDQMPWS